MAKDDYHVVVYQLLSYLYQVLKQGIDVDIELIKHTGRLCNIHEKYWIFIMKTLFNDGLISNIVIKKMLNNVEIVEGLEHIQITSKGIEYLMDNSFLQKAKQFLKDTKSIVPFI